MGTAISAPMIRGENLLGFLAQVVPPACGVRHTVKKI
jgi:hypothetical protein